MHQNGRSGGRRSAVFETPLDPEAQMVQKAGPRVLVGELELMVGGRRREALFAQPEATHPSVGSRFPAETVPEQHGLHLARMPVETSKQALVSLAVGHILGDRPPQCPRVDDRRAFACQSVAAQEKRRTIE